MNKKFETETTNLDILERLEKELNKDKNSEKKETHKKDEYAMLDEDYLKYSK